MNKQCGLVNGEWIEPPRVQDALSTLLASLGFKRMSEDVLTECDRDTLKRYARIVSKNAKNVDVTNNLRILGLI